MSFRLNLLSFFTPLLLIAPVLSAQMIERISEEPNGIGGNDNSFVSSISANGKFVAFYTYASNFTPNDNNYKEDVFLCDRTAGTIRCLSLNPSGATGDNHSHDCQLSADGRFVLFRSSATDLVANDNNGYPDLFLYDRTSDALSIVSINSSGQLADLGAIRGSISADGRFIVFSSRSTNLVSGSTNIHLDLFVHNRETGQTKLITRNTNGGRTNGSSINPSISADGRFVAFQSQASDLVTLDQNSEYDIFYTTV